MRVNEIFYSLQGEGCNTGTAAIFIRFSGCNLKCPFCDTDFKGYREMSVDDIMAEVEKLSVSKPWLVVLTGGEPTLQDYKPLVDALHKQGFTVAMESNGTNEIDECIDIVTISPKEAYVGNAGKVKVKYCTELKVVFDGINEPSDYGIMAINFYLQPCDTGDPIKNKEIIEKCINYIKANPRWKLSLQTQKILNVR